MKRTLVTALTSLCLICFSALVLRASFLWSQQSNIPHNVLAVVPFAQETGNIALALSEGKGFANVFRQETGPTAWLTPVYPLMVAAIFWLAGSFTFHAFLGTAALNILFSAATCIPIFFIGKRIGGPFCASLAAWLWAVYPHAILMPSEWMWDTSLSALLAALLLWFTLALAGKPTGAPPRVWILYGALWGFALLTNPALGAALPFLLGWPAYRLTGRLGARLRLPALSLAVAILCCLPWTVRNYFAFHQLVPLRSNFAFELWLGNNDIFDPQAIRGTQRITRFEQIRLYSELGEPQFMQEKWRIATSFMATHPALEAKLTVRRFIATWLGTETPWRDFWSSDSRLVRGIFLCNLLVAVAGFAGLLLLSWRRNPFAFPLAVFPVFFPLVYYLTHTSLRYRHPADPALIVLCAAALRAIWLLAVRRAARSSLPSSTAAA